MIVEREDNSALYFIVGALLVAVVAFAVYYFASDRPAASDQVTDTTRVESVAPASGSGASTTTLSSDGNGVSATTTTQQ